MSGIEISSDGLKWASIILIFLIQAFLLRGPGALKWIGAAGFTVLADYYLLFTDRWGIGILAFIFAHYLRLITLSEKREFLFAGLILAAIGLMYFFKLPWIEGLGLIYAALILSGTYFAIRKGKKVIIWGYLLFLACDLSVVLANFPIFGPGISSIFRKLIWVFYLPSQVLLAAGGLRRLKVANGRRE